METTEKKRKQKLTFNFVPAQREIENSKKIAKKLKKLKNTIMSSFQAKIGWKRQRKKNKNCRSVPTRSIIENSKKLAKKLKKIKKYSYGFF